MVVSMISVTINGNAINVEQNTDWLDDATEEFDVGSLLIVNTTSSTPYADFSDIVITNGADTYKSTLQRDIVTRQANGLYQHALVVTEYAIKLSMYQHPDRKFDTVDGDKTTYRYHLETILGTLVGYVAKTSPISVASDTLDLLDVDADEKEYTGGNLLITLLDMFRYVNAVPTFNENNEIGHKLLSEIGKEISFSRIDGEIIESDITDYGYRVHSKVKNATYESDLITGGTWFPSESDGATPRVDPNEQKYEDEKAIYVFPSNIRRIVDARGRNIGTDSGPETNWFINVVSKAEWDGLLVERDGDEVYKGDYKNNTPYWDGNQILNWGVEWDYETGTIGLKNKNVISQQIRRQLYVRDGNDNEYVNQDIDEIEVSFFYAPQRDMDVAQVRYDYERVSKNATVLNTQKDSTLELARYGTANKSYINRIGNDKYTVVVRYFDKNVLDPTAIPLGIKETTITDDTKNYTLGSNNNTIDIADGAEANFEIGQLVDLFDSSGLLLVSGIEVIGKGIGFLEGLKEGASSVDQEIGGFVRPQPPLRQVIDTGGTKDFTTGADVSFTDIDGFGVGDYVDLYDSSNDLQVVGLVVVAINDTTDTLTLYHPSESSVTVEVNGYIISTDLTAPFNVFDFTEDGYTIIKRQFIFRGTSFDVKYELTKNVSNLNPITGVKYEDVTPFTITGKSILTNFLYEEYYEFSDTDKTDDTSDSSVTKQILLNIFDFSSVVDTPLWNGTYRRGSSDYISMPCMCFSMGQSFLFNVQFNHPQFAGYKIVSDTLGKKIEPILYVDDFGQAESVRVQFSHEPASVNEDTYPLSTGFGLDRISMPIFNADIQPNEIFGLTFAKHCISDVDGLIIGDYFLENNSLVKTLGVANDIDVAVYDYNPKYTIYDRTLKGVVASTSTVTYTAGNKYFNINGVIGKSWAIYRNNPGGAGHQRILFAFNYTGTSLTRVYVNSLTDDPNINDL